jgi:hypothetical protein
MLDWTWKEIDALEAQGKYKQVLHHMYDTWQKEPMNLKVFLRLSFLVWYMLVENTTFSDMEDVKGKFEDLDDLESLLKELEAYGKTHFQHLPEFLWVYGYMTDMFPQFFAEGDDRIAAEMYKKAYELKPDDPVIKMLYFETLYFENKYDYKNSPPLGTLREKARNTLAERFQGEGEFQVYFRHVLKRNTRADS